MPYNALVRICTKLRRPECLDRMMTFLPAPCDHFAVFVLGKFIYGVFPFNLCC